mmetsp:Transcript_53648/g.141410  ORF Transcript_53648/g.141410 Transcript_53648/m.141410 type:complete len:207 (+) Transcript_53648:3-623(+)
MEEEGEGKTFDPSAMDPYEEKEVLRQNGLTAGYTLYLDDGTTFRTRYDKKVKELKERYGDLEPEFDDDNMNDKLPEADRKRGWHYPLTKTQQKHEYGCVVQEQQRFLWRLQDGHLDIVEDYVLNDKKLKAIDLNLYDDNGWTPLHHASARNYGEITKVLLEGKADPSLKDKVGGLTALDLAKMGTGDDSGPSDDVLEVLAAFGVRA